jgi:hypothetical protein
MIMDIVFMEHVAANPHSEESLVKRNFVTKKFHAMVTESVKMISHANAMMVSLDLHVT